MLAGVTAGEAQTPIERKAIESFKLLFGDSIAASPLLVRLSGSEMKDVSNNAKSRWASDSLAVYVCRHQNTIVGYGFVDNVKGKTQMITYLVVLEPDGVVADVDVLAYREAYGGEIAYESFRKQFRRKSFHDQLVPGRDIKNISGATISVRAITLGVKKIVTTFELIHDRLR